MKIQAFLATLAIAATTAFAQNPAAPAPTPMTVIIPVIPPGVNAATVPAPRDEWFLRVNKTNAYAHQQADKIQLVFDGDSITDGWQSNGQKVWAERYAKLNAFNFGISGDRTQQILWRLEQGQVDGIHPKLIAIMIGTNNSYANTPEQIAEGIKAIIDQYQKRCPEAVILLQAIFPRGEKADNPLRIKIKSINEIISKFADGKKVIYTDFGDKFLDEQGTLSREIMPDFLHPNQKGYQIWADAIQPIIDQYFPPQATQPAP